MGKSSKSTKRAREEDESAAPVETPAAVAMDVDTTSTTAPKSKKSKKDKSAGDEDSKEIPKEALAVIASPLAQKKTAKHVLKLVKKASKSRHLKRGVKEVVKSIRKGEKGIVVLAADISPIDILTHIPLLSEEANCPYIWVTSKEALGLASSTKRPTSCVMIAKVGLKRKLKAGEKEKDGAKETEEDFQTSYKEVESEVNALEESIPSY